MIDYTNKCIEFDSNTQYELDEKARNIVVEKEEEVQEKMINNTQDIDRTITTKFIETLEKVVKIV